ncbi:MAG: class I SAM-dependent methyltransferase [Xanthomonadales bacterium]|nr:class I SAM-dependent methyltransferase [Xanthomonadales bacterium]
MSYSAATFADRNPIKRWLQSRRLVTAMGQVDGAIEAPRILDFGAGNGELCKQLAMRFPRARLTCYEPAPFLMAQARQNLAQIVGVGFCTELASLDAGAFDLIFCLEVLEHLPPAETERVLDSFERLLDPHGMIVVGVPIETGLPAFYKGVFRMWRRFGAFDARIANVLRATAGSPPSPRPDSEIAPGLPFHHEHMGFDHRVLRRRLERRFALRNTVTSPFRLFGSWLNPEVNFVLCK